MNKSKKSLKLMLIEGNTEHRIININPKILKLAAWSVPFGTILLLVVFGALSLFFYNQIASIESSSSKQSVDINTQVLNYQKTVNDLQAQIQSLNEKLLSPADNASSLQLFVTTKGFKDLTSQTLVNVENFNFSIQTNTIDIKFELHNQSGSDRTTGYFFVLTYTPEQLIFYPNINQVQTELSFNQGETFNIGRFKNVIFKMPIPASSQQSRIKMRIIAFNRTGDLLFNKSFDIR